MPMPNAISLSAHTRANKFIGLLGFSALTEKSEVGQRLYLTGNWAQRYYPIVVQICALTLTNYDL